MPPTVSVAQPKQIQTQNEKSELTPEHEKYLREFKRSLKRISVDFNILKKFYKVYIHGFENAGEIRNDLMQFKNSQDTLQYIDTLKSKEV